MSTQYKATCKCGAAIDVPYSDNFKDWLNSHKECLKQQLKPEPATNERPLFVFAKECVLGAYKEDELADAAFKAIESTLSIKENT